jgi:nitroimidazol reductase NimA-like FMN-containing flavoprotein (pyridoxamine 5'-phosphate oxidase superfamily)
VGRRVMNKSEIEEILMKAKVGRLGMCLNDKPYLVPISFVYHNNKIYFHSANKGKKIDIMKKNPSICLQVDESNLVPNSDPCEFTFHYRSVIVFGTVRFLQDTKEKLVALRAMMNKYDRHHTAKPLNLLMAKNVVVGEISIQTITGKTNP